MKTRSVLITGGLGFIGSHFIHRFRQNHPEDHIVLLDKNTYAANIDRISLLKGQEGFTYVEADIALPKIVDQIFAQYQPEIVINFAAESHVDNSINGPALFLETNVRGTFNLLESARKLWMEHPQQLKQGFHNARFFQISTDEVFGSLGSQGFFNEHTNYAPNSPYSASKAAADHWVRSYYHTYKLPTLLSHCSNNYGPFQHDEKLIPTIIRTALKGEPIPIYGNGKNIRDWLFVEDHCEAIERILLSAPPGETYTIGGNSERTNLDICMTIIQELDKQCPRGDSESYEKQVTFVADRLGHDFRYAISADKIKKELNWTPQFTFEEGLKKTIAHYLEKYRQLT